MSRVRAVAQLDPLSEEDLEPVRVLLDNDEGLSVVVQLVASDGTSLQMSEHVGALVRRVLGAAADGQQIDLVGDVDELTPNEASVLLGVSRNTVLRLIAGGDLRARTLPGSLHRRLPREDVLAYRERRNALESALAHSADLAIEEGIWDPPEQRRPRRRSH